VEFLYPPLTRIKLEEVVVVSATELQKANQVTTGEDNVEQLHDTVSLLETAKRIQVRCARARVWHTYSQTHTNVMYTNNVKVKMSKHGSVFCLTSCKFQGQAPMPELMEADRVTVYQMSVQLS
jgi:hypothetical protein